MEKLDQQQLTLNKIQGPHIFVKVLAQNIEKDKIDFWIIKKNLYSWTFPPDINMVWNIVNEWITLRIDDVNRKLWNHGKGMRHNKNTKIW